MNQFSILNKLHLKKETLYNICRGVAIVAAVFSFVMCTLLITNYLQSRMLDPLENPALERLISQLQDNPQDMQLKAQIREIDLLSRKALFINQWQIRTGSTILLAAVILLLITLKTMDTLQTKLPDPQGSLDDNEAWYLSTKIRQGIAALGLFLIGTAVIFAMLSYSELAETDKKMHAATASPQDFARNWANFRGPGGLGISPSKAAPVAWDIKSEAGIRWHVPVPKPGFNSPILWGENIFLCGGDKNSLAIFCYNIIDGELLWRSRVDDPNDKTLAEFRPQHDTGFAAPTMATNGRFVFAIFNTGLIAACDFNGNLIWTKNLGVPENHYGHSSSLIVFENLLIVQYDQSANARLLALDTMSGSTVWRVKREIISWSSPVLINFDGRCELIVTDCFSVTSFDPKTGVKYWQVDCLDGEHAPSPAFAADMLVVGNEYSQATGLRLGKDTPESVWEYYDDLPDAVSPLATDEFVFFVASYGVVTCLDIKSGELLWTHDYKKNIYASPILSGKNIYLLDRNGTMHIFSAAKEFKSIADLPLGRKAAATPVIIDGRIYVRMEKSLICIGE